MTRETRIEEEILIVVWVACAVGVYMPVAIGRKAVGKLQIGKRKGGFECYHLKCQAELKCYSEVGDIYKDSRTMSPEQSFVQT